MSDLPPAGWYPDDMGEPGGLRYWDGSQWTEHVHDARTGPQHDDALEGSTQGLQASGWDPGMPSALPFDIPDPIPQSGRAWLAYRGDLKWSASALVASPWLVFVSIAPFVLLELRVRDVHPVALWSLLWLVAEVFFLGFTGSQRVWFLRRARGVGIHPAEVWTLSWRFFGRFLCLDLLFSIPIAAVAIPVIVANTHQVITSTGAVVTTTSYTWELTVALVALGFVFDVLLTFVVPALALSTRSVRASFRLGWQVTKRCWPTDAWYLFAPGITLLALSGALPRSVIPTGALIVLGLVSSFLALLFKGAIVAFYIRSVPPMGIDGAT